MAGQPWSGPGPWARWVGVGGGGAMCHAQPAQSLWPSSGLLVGGSPSESSFQGRRAVTVTGPRRGLLSLLGDSHWGSGSGRAAPPVLSPCSQAAW